MNGDAGRRAGKRRDGDEPRPAAKQRRDPDRAERRRRPRRRRRPSCARKAPGTRRGARSRPPRRRARRGAGRAAWRRGPAPRPTAARGPPARASSAVTSGSTISAARALCAPTETTAAAGREWPGRAGRAGRAAPFRFEPRAASAPGRRPKTRTPKRVPAFASNRRPRELDVPEDDVERPSPAPRRCPPVLGGELERVDAPAGPALLSAPVPVDDSGRWSCRRV